VQVVTLKPGQTTQLVSVITLTPSGTGTAAAQSTTAAAGSSSSGINTGAIIGIAVGVVGLLAIAGVLLFFFLRKRKQNSSSHEAPVSEPAYVGPYPPAGDGGNPQQSYANAAPVKSEAEKYQQAHQQYPPSTPSPAPAYSQPQPQQYNPYPQQPYNGHYVPPPNASYAELSAPQAPMYNGAAELHGRPSAPMNAHELPGH
jgi:LPXTG-motif cell wall-anchored protein